MSDLNAIAHNYVVWIILVVVIALGSAALASVGGSDDPASAPASPTAPGELPSYQQQQGQQHAEQCASDDPPLIGCP
ncbi:MAG: hypothetical protein V7607_1195 [Solirubrobacteraceae bacterium]